MNSTPRTLAIPNKRPVYFTTPSPEAMLALLDVNMPAMEVVVRQQIVERFQHRLETVGPINSKQQPMLDFGPWFLDYANRFWMAWRLAQ